MYYYEKKKHKVENISFLFVPRKFPKFSNLRKLMSVKCKNVTIRPKNVIFYANTACDMQVGGKQFINEKFVESFLLHALYFSKLKFFLFRKLCSLPKQFSGILK